MSDLESLTNFSTIHIILLTSNRMKNDSSESQVLPRNMYVYVYIRIHLLPRGSRRADRELRRELDRYLEWVYIRIPLARDR